MKHLATGLYSKEQLLEAIEALEEELMLLPTDYTDFDQPPLFDEEEEYDN